MQTRRGRRASTAALLLGLFAAASAPVVEQRFPVVEQGAAPAPTVTPVVEQGGAPAPTDAETPAPTQGIADLPAVEPVAATTAPAQGVARPGVPVATLPGGRTKVFAGKRFLVAYYGSSQTPALGVLGEAPPDRMHQRLLRAAKPFARKGQPVQPVYELIVSIADAVPGKDGDYSHDIPRAEVERYVRAAERNGALLLLDLQTGSSDFLTVAKRWRWALKHPYVGLALDPEWRMRGRHAPGQVIGSVKAAEVNRVSSWLARLVERKALPEKLFVLHQFRLDMLPDVQRIEDRPGLALVQHVDGFGTPGQKLDTFHTVARPKQFAPGFKLFYDEDVPRMSAAAVHRIRPKVRFVSFQ